MIKTDPNSSILAKVRSEAYRDGLGQASMVAYDDAYALGRIEGGQAAQRGKARWGFLFGILLGVFSTLTAGYIF